LHDNEKTAVETAVQTISSYGGSFITIENEGRRNISFTLKGRKYSFDPNRIFTSEGRKQTLGSLGNYSQAAENELQDFARAILELVPAHAVIIAIHNNTNHRFSITDYNNERKTDALSIHINNEMDEDDFIITTDKKIYEKLVERNINAVLQDNERVKDDGSLSVYFGKEGRIYINIEAEHGHTREQTRMIYAVLEVLGI
jgi:hypothetical protein